jgi:ubiquitin-conjugating enzyme E2 S
MEPLSPQVIKHILKELKEMDKETLEGIKIELLDGHVDEVYVWLEGPQGTPYEGGWFKIKLVFGNEFPEAPPKGTFCSIKIHKEHSLNDLLQDSS